MTIGSSTTGILMRMALPPGAGFARPRHQPDPAARRHESKEGRAVAGLGRNREIVAAPQAANESKRLRQAVGRSDMVLTSSTSGLPLRMPSLPRNTSTSTVCPREASADGADERRRQQHVAQAAQRHHQDARALR